MWLLFKLWSPAHHTKHNSGAKGLACVHFASYFVTSHVQVLQA